jgi:adenylate cyclase
MGDGMLAIFPIAAAQQRPTIARRAVQAAASVGDAMLVLNRIRAAADEPAVRFGLALHIGEVMFGNIGASNRLDFTVIGPAVNYAARLEKICGQIDQPILLSSAIASLLPEGETRPIGRHTLKDIDQPQAIFGLHEAGV